MNSTIEIFNDDEKKIAPKNFSLLITISIVAIIFGFLIVYLKEYEIYFKEYEVYFNAFYTFLSIWIAIGLRKYLRNFTYGKAIHWLNMSIVISILMLAVLIIKHASNIGTFADVKNNHEQLTVYLWYWLASIMLLLWLTIVGILFGISLQKIPDDFIGLLSGLGIMHTYVMPIALLGIAVMATVPYLKEHKIWIYITQELFSAVALLIITAIFYRARKFREQQNRQPL